MTRLWLRQADRGDEVSYTSARLPVVSPWLLVTCRRQAVGASGTSPPPHRHQEQHDTRPEEGHASHLGEPSPGEPGRGATPTSLARPDRRDRKCQEGQDHRPGTPPSHAITSTCPRRVRSWRCARGPRCRRGRPLVVAVAGDYLGGGPSPRRRAEEHPCGARP